MSKQVRQFVLYRPILSQNGAMLMPAMLPTYGIFEFEDDAKILQNVATYDLDETKISLEFSQIRNNTEDIPFETIEEIRKEIERIRIIERYLSKINPTEDVSPFNNLFAKEAVLLTQLRMLKQFEIVINKFDQEGLS